MKLIQTPGVIHHICDGTLCGQLSLAGALNCYEDWFSCTNLRGDVLSMCRVEYCDLVRQPTYGEDGQHREQHIDYLKRYEYTDTFNKQTKRVFFIANVLCYSNYVQNA